MELVSRALDQAARGRHAEAERGLREAIGCMARRGHGSGAASAALVLGRLLLERGRSGEARGQFESARAWFDAAGCAAGVVEAATGIGVALTDEARLLEAEAALRSAAIAAVTIGARREETAARLALSRCLLWLDRVEEAAGEIGSAQIEGADDDGARPVRAGNAGRVGDSVDFQLAACCLEARIALARHDTVRATAAARAAASRAKYLGGPLAASAAHRAEAAVYASTGDTVHLREHAALGIDAARRAHAPLRAVRLRLVLLEGLTAAAETELAARTLRALSRVRADRLPALLRQRLEAALRNGLKPRLAAGIRPEWFDEVAGILAICRDTEDERSLVVRLAADLRQRLRASAVLVAGADCTGVHELAAAGCSGPLGALVGRVVDSGLAIGPAFTPYGVEMAVAVRQAGRPVGALACRWPVDRAVDGAKATMLLATAAAAVSPIVSTLLDRRANPLQPANAENNLIGTSESVESLRRAIRRAAAVPFPVLIEGESGSGKEVVARAIHREGPRRLRRFCAFNCAAITDELIEAELFGYARGAFTGALADRVGLFEDADGGTLFLDEVSDLSPRAQAKLLRVIQEGEIRRVGENVTRAIDVRIVAASNRPLAGEVVAGRFRKDLAYRLDVFRIQVPPLRQRVEDIPALALHFWSIATGRAGSRASLAPATLAALARYAWPGNVRELQNVVAVLAAVAPRRGSVGPAALPLALRAEKASSTPTLDSARRTMERRMALEALAEAGGRRTEAAAALGMTRQGFAKLLARLNLDEEPELAAGEQPVCAVAESPPPWPGGNADLPDREDGTGGRKSRVRQRRGSRTGQSPEPVRRG